MSKLVELRNTLVTTSRPDRWLSLADDYLTRFEALGNDFVLPAEHVLIRPILEYYVGDLDGWVKFIRGVRDRLTPKSTEYMAVHELYKTLSVRAIQRRNRDLIGVATEVAVKKKMIDGSFESKQRYEKRCRQVWKQRRDTLLKNVRSASPTGRVSTDHREALLKEFWDLIGAEVNNGEVPKA